MVNHPKSRAVLNNEKLLRALVEAVENMRVDLDNLRSNNTAEIVAARDARLTDLTDDMDRIKAALFDERAPEELAKDPDQYRIKNVDALPGVREAARKEAMAKALVGRAAQRMGMTVPEWLTWCREHGWDTPTRMVPHAERARFNRQAGLPFEEPKPKPKRGRGRPRKHVDAE